MKPSSISRSTDEIAAVASAFTPSGEAWVHVVRERRPRIGDPLVAERDEERRGARRFAEHVGADPHAIAAPLRLAAQVVLERPGRSRRAS